MSKSVATTKEEVWRLFKETDRQMDKLFAETNWQIKETEKNIKRTLFLSFI